MIEIVCILITLVLKVTKEIVIANIFAFRLEKLEYQKPTYYNSKKPVEDLRIHLPQVYKWFLEEAQEREIHKKCIEFSDYLCETIEDSQNKDRSNANKNNATRIYKVYEYILYSAKSKV